MKSVFATLAFVLTCIPFSPAHATSPIWVPRPMVTYSVGSGFIPYGRLSTRIILMDNGSVKVTETVRDRETGNTTTRTYDSQWYFEEEVMAKVRAAFTLLTTKAPGELVDLDASKPICMDAPTTSLKVVKYGAETLVSTLSGCHTSLPRDASQKRAAQYLMRDMQNLYRSILAQPH